MFINRASLTEMLMWFFMWSHVNHLWITCESPEAYLDVPNIVLLRVSSLFVNSSLSMVMLSTVSENVSFCVEPPSIKDDDITVDWSALSNRNELLFMSTQYYCRKTYNNRLSRQQINFLIGLYTVHLFQYTRSRGKRFWIFKTDTIPIEIDIFV